VLLQLLQPHLQLLLTDRPSRSEFPGAPKVFRRRTPPDF